MFCLEYNKESKLPQESLDKLRKGPDWLVKSRDQWPVTEVQLEKADREVVKSFERVSQSFKAEVVTVQGDKIFRNIFDDIIERSESLDKIVNLTASVLRLAGRAGKKIPESYKKLGLQEKYDSNPITAEEHEIALLTLIHHEQKKLDVKKFSGFNISKKEVEVTPTKTLSLFIMRSRVQNFPIGDGNESNFVYPLPKGAFAKRIVLRYHKKFHKDLDTVCAHVRRKYWIQNMRKIAASIDRNCKFCLILVF